jgi:hypothetical protein
MSHKPKTIGTIPLVDLSDNIKQFETNAFATGAINGGSLNMFITDSNAGSNSYAFSNLWWQGTNLIAVGNGMAIGHLLAPMSTLRTETLENFLVSSSMQCCVQTTNGSMRAAPFIGVIDGSLTPVEGNDATNNLLKNWYMLPPTYDVFVASRGQTTFENSVILRNQLGTFDPDDYLAMGFIVDTQSATSQTCTLLSFSGHTRYYRNDTPINKGF